jgi:hypothetical protein
MQWCAVLLSDYLLNDGTVPVLRAAENAGRLCKD